MEAVVRFLARVEGSSKEVNGTLSMTVEKDKATDTYLGCMPSLKLYSQGRTPEEAEGLMEKAVNLYLQTALRHGQLSDILLASGFRRIRNSGDKKPAETVLIRTISPQPTTSSEES